MKQRNISPSSRKRKSSDETQKQTRKKACNETYKITTVTGRGEHSNHIDVFKIFEQLPPRELTKLFDNATGEIHKKTRKKACEEQYRISTVTGRGAHSKHIDNCKIQKRKQ